MALLDSKKIPTCIEDCIKTNPLTENLRNWSRKIEEYGKALMALIIVVGVLASFNAANIQVSMMETKFNVVVFLAGLLTYGLYAFVEYCIYQFLSMLVLALASIVHNTRSTALLAELTARNAIGEAVSSQPSDAKPANPPVSAVPPRPGSVSSNWECPKCGCHNTQNNRYCKSCGAQKPN